MAANLQRVVDDVVSGGPDHVLFNGDLAFAKGEHGDYAAFQDLIAPLRGRGMPLHLTLGNHDHRARLLESFGVAADAEVTEKAVSSLFISGVQWLFLDSLERVDAIRGSLGRQQRAWLTRQLDSNAGPAIVCVHHNPERSLVGLKDTEEFLGIVTPRRRVKLVLFGHTHRFRVWQTDGLHFVNLPAVGFWFNPEASLGWVWARIGQGGVRLELRGISSREQGHGATRDLAWRSDK
jgi:Icc protein